MRKLVLLIVVLMPVLIHGQTESALDVQVVGGEALYNVFYASFFDPATAESQPILFTVEIRNQGEQSLSYYLIVDLLWNNTSLLSNQRVIANQPIEPGGFDLVTSRQIISDENNPDFNAEPDVDFDTVLSRNPRFKNIVLSTGRFPDGSYTFTAQAFETGTDETLSGISSRSIEILSPVSIDLISPGVPLGNQVTGIYETYPIFSWFSNLEEYRLNVFEVDSWNTTAEQIERSSPLYTVSTVMNNHPYPPDAPVLEPGKTYAWQVTGILTTPAGTGGDSDVTKSPVFTFQIIEPGQDNQARLLVERLLRSLNIAGVDEAHSLLTAGYHPGTTIHFQGRDYPVEHLNVIISQIINRELIPQKLEME